MKVALPLTCAPPRPSRASDSMVARTGAAGGGLRIRRDMVHYRTLDCASARAGRWRQIAPRGEKVLQVGAAVGDEAAPHQRAFALLAGLVEMTALQFDTEIDEIGVE